MAISLNAENPIEVNPDFEQSTLLQQLDYYLSPVAHISIDSLLDQAHLFTPMDRAAPNFPQSKHSLWFRFEVVNTSDRTQSMIVDLGSVVVNYTQLFVQRSDGRIDSTHLIGDRVNFDRREIPYRVPSLPFLLEKGESVLLYLYVHKYDESIILPMRLWTKDAWTIHLSKEEIWTGVILVVGILVLLISWLLLLIAPSGQTASYALFAFATIAYVLLHRGVGGQYLWPDFPTLNNVLRIPLFASSFAALLLFVQYFLKARQSMLRLYQIVDVLLVFFACAIGVSFFENSFPLLIKPLFPLFALVELVAIFMLLLLPLWHFYKFRAWKSLMFLLAFAFTLSMAIIGVLGVGFGVPINNFLVNKMIYFGLLGDSCVLLALLAYDQYWVRLERRELASDLSASREEAMRNLIFGQMQERQRLSQQLHDGVGVLLASLRMRMSSLLSRAPKKEQGDLRLIVNDLGRVSEDLRNFSHDLSPVALEKYGLLSALGDQVFQLNKYSDGVEVLLEVDTFSDSSLMKYQEETLYFIALELLNNALKHAKAKKIILQIIEEEKSIILNVVDDGTGYFSGPDVSGLGLQNIELRLRLINGQFIVIPNEPCGTISRVLIAKA